MNLSDKDIDRLNKLSAVIARSEHEGEWQAAAIAYFRILRKKGQTLNLKQRQKPVKFPTPEFNPGWADMRPFPSTFNMEEIWREISRIKREQMERDIRGFNVHFKKGGFVNPGNSSTTTS